tara:strand:- start:222 stop:395 length:174 start_codon:yes stop_codon:yes gene_type:complete
MKKENCKLDELLFKICTLEDSLKILKKQLNRVYNMCDTHFSDDEEKSDKEKENEQRN